MVLELHVYVSAFGLPSIDPECNAAFAYVSRTLSSDQWALFPTWSEEDTQGLPLLRDPDRSTSASGYSRIVALLSSKDDDSEDDPLTWADNFALSNHLSSSLRPIIDHQLYANRKHFTHFTRPAWARQLPFPWNYTIPSAWSAAASRRAASSGLSASSTSLEIPKQELPQQDLATAEASITSSSPSLLFGSSRLQTLKTLAQEQSALRFRIDAIIDDALEPLDDALKAGSTNGEQPSRRDSDSWRRVECTCLGYIGLLLHFPGALSPHQDEEIDRTMPNRIAERWPKVTEWVTALHEETFADWKLCNVQQPRLPTLLARGAYCFDYTLDCIMPYHKRHYILKHTWPFSSSLALSGLIGLTASLGWIAYGLITARGEHEKTFFRPHSAAGFRSMGEAGALLGVLAGLGSGTGGRPDTGRAGELDTESNPLEGAPIAEASIEVTRELD
ncbi:MAG: hypothetical protein M1828_000231 [Chrysothrix sp. TS-e1954]|nr:MAG: hypothetical protein M1828_000231 [Chrysothrix sp. TS-e1954]